MRGARSLMAARFWRCARRRHDRGIALLGIIALLLAGAVAVEPARAASPGGAPQTSRTAFDSPAQVSGPSVDLPSGTQDPLSPDQVAKARATRIAAQVGFPEASDPTNPPLPAAVAELVVEAQQVEAQVEAKPVPASESELNRPSPTGTAAAETRHATIVHPPTGLSGACSPCAMSAVTTDVPGRTYGATYAVAQEISPLPSYANDGYQNVTLVNTSNFTWEPNQVYLTYHLYTPGGEELNDPGFHIRKTALPFAVPPNYSLTLPGRIGGLPGLSYTLVWDLQDLSISDPLNNYFSDRGVPAAQGVSFTVPDLPPTVYLDAPANYGTVGSLTPTFSLTVAGDWTSTPRVEIVVCPGTGTLITDDCVRSGPKSVSLDPATFAGSLNWVFPSDAAKKLRWNQLYSWRAGIWNGPMSDPNPFLPFAGDDPILEGFGANATSVDVAGVNYVTHRYFRQDIDASVPTSGLPLQIVRTYNSGDTRASAFGPGWSSVLDMKAGPLETPTVPGQTFFRYADGKTSGYAPNQDGTYTSAFGSSAGATVNNVGSFTQANGDTYSFAPDTSGGTGHIAAIVAANGARTDFEVDGHGRVLAMTDAASGRTLRMTWGAYGGARVSKVEVVAGGVVGATWTYTYDGAGFLRQVCDPSAAQRCTTYRVDSSGRTDQFVKGRGAATAVTVGYATGSDLVDQVTLPASAAGDPAPVWRYYRDQSYDDSSETADVVLSPTGKYHFLTYDVTGGLKREWYGTTAATLPTETNSRGYVPDLRGHVQAKIDENGNETDWLYAADGQLLHTLQPADSSGFNATTDYGYDFQASPRWKQQLVTSVTVGGSATTSYTYTASGQLRSKTLPKPDGSPGGANTTYSYTCDGGAAAPAAVNNTYSGEPAQQPCGLLSATRDPAGLITLYAYSGAGDATRVTTPAGLVTNTWFDAFGRPTKKTVTNGAQSTDSYFQYNATNQMTGQLDPAVVNPITQVSHQLATTFEYDLDGNLTKKTLSDQAPSGADPSREFTYAYDNADRLTTTWNNGIQTDRMTYNVLGAVRTSQAGAATPVLFTYDAKDLLAATTTTDGGTTVTLNSYTYDPGGRLQSTTDALGQEVYRTYSGDNLVTGEYLRIPGTEDGKVLHQYTYDTRRNKKTDTQGSGAAARKRTFAYDGADRPTSTTLDPVEPPTNNGLNRTIRTDYDAYGRLQLTTLSQGSDAHRTGLTYDTSGHVNAVVVDDGAGHYLTTRPGSYTPAGQPQTVQDAENRTTRTDYDVLGRVSKITRPVTSLYDGGSTTANLVPVEVHGYNTFGELTDLKTPNGNVTRTTYDPGGRKVRVDYPAYTAPATTTPVAAFETWTYDANDNVKTHTDRGGRLTTFTYDGRNRLLTAVGTSPGSGVAAPTTTYTYNNAGLVTSMTDPFGAKTYYRYNMWELVDGIRQVVRHPNAASTNQDTVLGYNDFGDVVSTSNGATNVTASYNAAGEKVSETVAGRGTAHYAYDAAGNLIGSTDFSGRISTTDYDAAGRVHGSAVRAPNGTVLTSETYGVDGVGNRTSVTDASGTTDYEYNDLDWLTKITDPAPVNPSNGQVLPRPVTQFGYDPDGNRTAVIDGRGNLTSQTFNVWGLPEKRTVPATAQQSTAQTWLTGYNPDGTVDRTLAPGGVFTDYSYDGLGRLTSQSASGGGAASATRSFGYDAADRLTSINTPVGTNQTFSYDDRGLLLGSAGPEGTPTVNVYSGTAPLLQSSTDAAGTTTYTYNSGTSDVATATDTMTGTGRAYSYNTDGQVTSEVNRVNGTPVSLRSHEYDGLGRPSLDKITNASGQVTVATSQTWDAVGNLLTDATYGTGVDPYSTAYTYDSNDRLTTARRTSASGTIAELFTWDAASNRTSASTGTCTDAQCSGGPSNVTTTAFSYDARNRVQSSTTTGGATESTTYAWSPRGTLDSMTRTPGGGAAVTVPVTFDGLNRLTNVAGATYYYDGLDRIAGRTANGVTAVFAYNGLGQDPVKDDIGATSRDQAGQPVAAQVGSLAGNLLSDPHGNVLAATAPSTAAVAGKTSYDPFGLVLSDSGVTPAAGYQGSYTDAGSGLLHAGARWYAPWLGSFLSEDAAAPPIASGSDANLYLYANANPASRNDPNGAMSLGIGIDIPISTSWIEDGIGQAERYANNAKNAVGTGVRVAASGVEAAGGGLKAAGSGLKIAGAATLRTVGPRAAGFAARAGAGSLAAACVASVGCVVGVSITAVVAIGVGVAVYQANSGDSSSGHPRAVGDPALGTGPAQVAQTTAPGPGPKQETQRRTWTGSQTLVTGSDTAVSHFYDELYSFTQTDIYTYTTTYQYTYFEGGGRVTTGTSHGTSHSVDIVAKLLIDLEHTVPAIIDAVTGEPQKPANATDATTSGTCGQGRAMSACAPTSGGALPGGSVNGSPGTGTTTKTDDAPPPEPNAAGAAGAGPGGGNNDRCVRNGHLAGTNHGKTGVPFDAEGFPDFTDWKHPGVPDVRINLTGNRAKDERAANLAAGLSKTPAGYTWHHSQDVGLMQLVDTKTHLKTGHTGGYSLRC
jgi:RHS repeat-associated protein